MFPYYESKRLLAILDQSILSNVSPLNLSPNLLSLLMMFFTQWKYYFW